MQRQPTGYSPNGQLKECSRCGFIFRWIQLKFQNGSWLDSACLDKGHVFKSVDSSDDTPTISTPTGLTATVNSAIQITLTWTDVSSIGSVAIERSDNSDDDYSVIAWVNVGTETYVDDVGENVLYYYRIRAYDSAAGYSSYTSAQHVNTITGIRFNGLNAYFSNSNAQTSLDPALQSFVIEWDMLTATPVNASEFILSTGYEEGVGGIDIYWSSQNLKFGISDPTDAHGLTLSVNLNTLINDGLTHRFSVVFNRTALTMEMFVDGVSVGSADASDMSGQTILIPKISIGRRSDGGGTYFTGRLFGLNWMNGTTTPTTYTSPLQKVLVTSYTVGNWQMSETSGPIVSTNGISLTAFGSPTYRVFEG